MFNRKGLDTVCFFVYTLLIISGASIRIRIKNLYDQITIFARNDFRTFPLEQGFSFSSILMQVLNPFVSGKAFVYTFWTDFGGGLDK